jgi:DNA-binding transcriptional MerR regulator
MSTPRDPARTTPAMQASILDIRPASRSRLPGNRSAVEVSHVRIGELAGTVGVSADTIRFYERAGLLPRPPRGENRYRQYSAVDADHLRLLVDLRALDIPLPDAASVAAMCHSGHCADTNRELPLLIERQRDEIAQRIARFRALDARLAALARHLAPTTLLPMASNGACCDAAAAILTAGEGRCACCVLETT